MQKPNFTEQVISIVEKHAEITVDKNNLDLDLIKEYRIESLTRVRILVDVEKTFGLDISEEEAFELNTIAKTVAYVETKSLVNYES